ncbi:ArsR/SmtB family transcription factor [Actinoplanes sp. URMC 104]|uniref:ArsR/SmtB family transcription factor n=1 Tax=Actinoplanes sp. URMC 104 TaxID=3423409 RepID=UPI003F1C0E63
MRTSEGAAGAVPALKALASPIRLQVLAWLKDPVAHFPAQVDGDLVEDGVCADFLRDKLDLAASTTSRHLSVLADAGFLVATRKKGWTFYRRDEARIAAFVEDLRGVL